MKNPKGRFIPDNGSVEFLLLAMLVGILISLFSCTRSWIKETKDAKYKDAASTSRLIKKGQNRPQRELSGYQVTY